MLQFYLNYYNRIITIKNRKIGKIERNIKWKEILSSK